MLSHYVLEVLESRIIQYDVLFSFRLLVESRVGRSLYHLFTLSFRNAAEASYHFLHGFEPCTTLGHLFLAFEHRDVFSD